MVEVSLKFPRGTGSPTDIDIVNRLFEHRLEQDDLDQILAVLSRTERDVLVAKMGDLLRRVSALLDVQNQVSDTLSLDVMLARLIEIITNALDAERSTLFLIDNETNELYSRVALGNLINEIRFPSGEGIAGSAFTTGEPIIIDDAYADPRFNPRIDQETGFRTNTILCAPLRNRHGRVLGASQILNKRAGPFDESDCSLLEAITAQAAAALENAQLHERVERARREEAQMLEVTNAISTELKLEPLLRKIISVTTDILDADRSTLFLHDDKTDELWSQVAEGEGMKEIRFPASAGLACSCFRSGEPINIPDAYAEPRFNQEVDRMTGYRTRNLLCMPVVNKVGTAIGVTQVLNKRGGPFEASDESRLKAFSAQAAISIENAKLFEDVLNERNYSESILKSLSNGVVTLDAEQHLITVNAAAQKILRSSAEDIVGKSAFEMFHHENSWISDSIAKVIESGETDITMDNDMTVGDQVVSVNLTTVPLIDTNDQPIGFMLVFEDITSEKRVKGTMARYMSKDVLDQVLENGESILGGRAQEVSILFSDIRSFTSISERIGARETVSMLNDYFSEMVDIIFSRRGILDKYIGDAIMAVFGTPFISPEDTDNALTVANEMIRTLRRFNEERATLGRDLVQIGIGVNTGEVVAGNIGSPKRMDYTVIGDGVNLAARLEAATKYYRAPILMSEFTKARIKSPSKSRELDLIRVKGKAQPVAIFEALDHHTEASFPRMAETIEAYAQGLELYRARNWRGAAGAFEEALGFRADDGPSRLYLERARFYESDPPGDEWDGVWTMLEK